MKNFFKILCCAMLLSSCSKGVEPKPSKEVLVTVWNECACSITFYKEDRQYLRDQYDCAYIKVMPVYLEDGTYKVVADNGFGKVVEVAVVKRAQRQELTIEF